MYGHTDSRHSALPFVGEVDFAAERGAGIPARGQTLVDAAVAVERAGERGLDALRVEVGGEAEVGIADHVAARVRTQAQAAVGRGDGHVALPGVTHRTQPAVDRDLAAQHPWPAVAALATGRASGSGQVGRL